jgi:NTP pyrophosphatase (non-canonical NTP hydrolase)
MSNGGMMAGNELVRDLHTVAEAVQAWQTATFGGASPLLARIAKLEEEVAELRAAAEAAQANPCPAMSAHVDEELADVGFLVLDIARGRGMGPSRLAAEVAEKLRKNERRTWAQAADGQFSHVKGGGR